MAELHQHIDTVFHRCIADNGTRVCEEKVTEHMIAHLFSGEMIVSVGDRKAKVHKGETVLIRRNHLVSKVKQPAGGEPFQGVFLHLEAGFLKTIARHVIPGLTGDSHVGKDAALMRLLLYPIEDNPLMDGFFRSLDVYFSEGRHPSMEILKLKLREIVQIIVETRPELVPVLFDCLDDWKPDLTGFMDKNFASELSVEEFAHYTGRSLSAFKRDFARLYDTTPSRWIVSRRLEEAHRLLTETSATPADVYLEVGFKNLSHFSTAFKKKYGVPPSMLQS